VSSEAGSFVWERKAAAASPSNSEPGRPRLDTEPRSALFAAPLLALGRAFLHILVELRRTCVPPVRAAARCTVAVELVVEHATVRAEVSAHVRIHTVQPAAARVRAPEGCRRCLSVHMLQEWQTGERTHRVRDLMDTQLLGREKRLRHCVHSSCRSSFFRLRLSLGRPPTTRGPRFKPSLSEPDDVLGRMCSWWW
jgi:hypothetical protein